MRTLALMILDRLALAYEVNRRNFIAGVYATMPPPPGLPAGLQGRSMHNEPEAARALGEAWDWLHLHGLVSPDPVLERNNYFVTRRGHRVAADVSALDEGW